MAVFLVAFWAAALMTSIFAVPIRFICGEGILAERLGWYPLWWDTLTLIGFQLFVYGPAAVLGEFFGVKARKRYGEKLRENK